MEFSESWAGIEAVFFDAGGTLIRTRRPVGETYAELASHYGQKWEAEALQAAFRGVYASMNSRPASMARRSDGDGRPWWRALVRETLARVGLPEHFPFDDYFEEAYKFYARADAWMPYPEAESALAAIRASGRRLAVLSNWDARIHAVFEGLELRDYFEVVLASAELGSEKPEPEIFRLAAARLGVDPPACLMVGDDAINDVGGAQAAAWKAYEIRRPQRDLASLAERLRRHPP
jgi:putative hydrolase of the HAD superfamily